MSKVFVNIGLSLDGDMAPQGMTLEPWDRREYRSWGARWGARMAWIVRQQCFRENLKLGPGGETGPVNDVLRRTTERIGANIMGRRMFEQGRGAGRGRERSPRGPAFDPLSSTTGAHSTRCAIVRRHPREHSPSEGLPCPSA